MKVIRKETIPPLLKYAQNLKTGLPYHSPSYTAHPVAFYLAYWNTYIEPHVVLKFFLVFYHAPPSFLSL